MIQAGSSESVSGRATLAELFARTAGVAPLRSGHEVGFHVPTPAPGPAFHVTEPGNGDQQGPTACTTGIDPTARSAVSATAVFDATWNSRKAAFNRADKSSDGQCELSSGAAGERT